MTVFDAALKFAVAADVAVILTVPTFFAATLPAVVTVAIAVFEDLYDFLPFAPVTEIVTVFPTATEAAEAFAVIFWAALLIVNVAFLVPV